MNAAWSARMAIALLCAIALVPSTTLAQNGETQSGAGSRLQLRRGGRPLELRFAAATRFVPVAGPARIHLVFSSEPLGEKRLANEFGEDHAGMMRWAAEREAAVLTLSMNAGREAFYTGTIVVGPLARSFAGKREGGGGAIPSLQISDARIAGHVAISHDAGDIAGRFELPFESVKEVPFTSTGVAETPQATVLLAYAAALTRLDMAAAQAHSTSALEQEFLAARQELGEKFVRQMIAERYGDVASLERELRSAAASFRQAGDMAQIRVSRLPPGGGPADGRTQTFTFVRVDGKWKVR